MKTIRRDWVSNDGQSWVLQIPMTGSEPDRLEIRKQEYHIENGDGPDYVYVWSVLLYNDFLNIWEEMNPKYSFTGWLAGSQNAAEDFYKSITPDVIFED